MEPLSREFLEMAVVQDPDAGIGEIIDLGEDRFGRRVTVAERRRGDFANLTAEGRNAILRTLTKGV